MWLEEMAWVWLPIVGGYFAWATWRIFRLERQVNDLRKQLVTYQHDTPASTLYENSALSRFGESAGNVRTAVPTKNSI